VLFVSRRNGLAPMPKLNALLGAIINFGRSLPFIVLLIALIPLNGFNASVIHFVERVFGQSREERKSADGNRHDGGGAA
jgi:hypothetical protein